MEQRKRRKRERVPRDIEEKGRDTRKQQLCAVPGANEKGKTGEFSLFERASTE